MDKVDKKLYNDNFRIVVSITETKTIKIVHFVLYIVFIERHTIEGLGNPSVVKQCINTMS